MFVCVLFKSVNYISDVLFLRFPFYFELKIAFVIWLLSPYTKGSSVLYRKFVHPTLSNKEKVSLLDILICQPCTCTCCSHLCFCVF